MNGTGGIFGAQTLILNGTGFAGANLAGALSSTTLNATQTWQGNIVVNPGATIGVSNGGTLILPGIVSGSGDLTKVGTNTLILLANNTYTGNTVIDAGTLTLQAAGNALNSSGFVVNPGATLTLDNNGNGNSTSVNLANRISSSQSVTLNGGTLNYIANPGAGVAPIANNDKIGTITLGPGQSTIMTGYTATSRHRDDVCPNNRQPEPSPGRWHGQLRRERSRLDTEANRIVFHHRPNNGR